MIETLLIPENWDKKLGNIIKVIGVGGGGCNAVRNMYAKGIKDVDFIVCNTDAQVLGKSPVPTKIQIGKMLTKGLGAGCDPEKGRDAALENIDEIKEILAQNTQMVFIATGLGGGTGTGAAPIIAKEAKDMGILTVAIATLPFKDEGDAPYKRALDGLDNLKKSVDSLLIINSQKLYDMCPTMSVFEAFPIADDIVTTAAKSIAELITTEGYINVDFADVKMVMTNSGMALMGLGKAAGENRVRNAAEKALNSPLLNNNDISGAKNILVNVSSGEKHPLQMGELGELMNYINEASGKRANFKRGVSKDLSLDDELSDAEIAVTIIATGFYEIDAPSQETETEQKTEQKNIVTLDGKACDADDCDDTNVSLQENDINSGIVVRTVCASEASKPSLSGSNISKSLDSMTESDIDMIMKIPAYERANAHIAMETTVTGKVARYRLDDSDEVHAVDDDD
jgi:cell division protein FtsZ